MGRPKRPRPKRYKSYLRAYAEADNNDPPEIPESTLRSRRKRKLEDLSWASSASDLDTGNDALEPNGEGTGGQADNVSTSEQATTEESSASSQADSEDEFIPSESSGDEESTHQDQDSDFKNGQRNVRSPTLESAQTTGGKSTRTCESSGDEQCTDHDQNSDVENGQRNLRSPTPESTHTTGESRASSSESREDEQSTDQDQDSELGNNNDERNEGSVSSQASSQANGSNESQSSQDAGDDGPIELYKNLKMKLQGNFQDPLNVTVKASVGEIMTNALTLVKKHNWNHTEKEDLMKFTNSLLDMQALPSSRFLLDKYLYSKEGMRYQFFCSSCSQFLIDVCAAQHTLTQVLCPNDKCSKTNVISDLSKASYFVTYDLPSQLNLLLSDPEVRCKLLNPVDFINEPDDSIMRDLHHGSSYRTFANYVHKLPNPRKVKYMSFTLSVDSAALCSSFSGQSICPCFIMINELPPVLRMRHLLIAGLWFGTKKEKMDLYLPPVVKHITDLSSPGFVLKFDEDEEWQVKAYLIACVADSVARCDVQGIHSHRGDFPCSWCLCEGEEYINSRIFPYESNLPPPRTIQNLIEDSREAARTKTFVHGVKYLCLLAAAPLFHSVHGLIVDQMHAKDEGVTKAFLNSWLGEDGKRPYYIGKPNIKKVNDLLQQMKIPRELRKSVRTFSHLSYWTGRELENWSFFFSLSTLSGILPLRYLNHWALYVQGTYLLLSCNIHPDAIDIAEDLLKQFCKKTEHLYGRHMLKFNHHILQHFCENARRWGPLFALSAYAMEAGNRRLKQLVNDCNGIPNQICRGNSEEKALLILKKSCDTTITQSFEKAIEPKSHANRVKFVGKLELLGVTHRFRPSREERWHFDHARVNVEDCVEYKLIKKDGCHYGTGQPTRETKTDNSYAKLRNTSIIHIQKIIHNERTNDVWVLGKRVRVEPSRYCPQSVVRYDTSLCCQFNVTSTDEDISIYDVSELDTICVNMPFDHGHFITPMPNIFNMF